MKLLLGESDGHSPRCGAGGRSRAPRRSGMSRYACRSSSSVARSRSGAFSGEAPLSESLFCTTPYHGVPAEQRNDVACSNAMELCWEGAGRVFSRLALIANRLCDRNGSGKAANRRRCSLDSVSEREHAMRRAGVPAGDTLKRQRTATPRPRGNQQARC